MRSWESADGINSLLMNRPVGTVICLLSDGIWIVAVEAICTQWEEKRWEYLSKERVHGTRTCNAIQAKMDDAITGYQVAGVNFDITVYL